MKSFTNLIISTLKDIKADNPELSFGEVLYSTFRKENLPEKPSESKTSWLLEITDEQFYMAAERMIKNKTEKED